MTRMTRMYFFLFFTLLLFSCAGPKKNCIVPDQLCFLEGYLDEPIPGIKNDLSIIVYNRFWPLRPSNKKIEEKIKSVAGESWKDARVGKSYIRFKEDQLFKVQGYLREEREPMKFPYGKPVNAEEYRIHYYIEVIDIEEL